MWSIEGGRAAQQFEFRPRNVKRLKRRRLQAYASRRGGDIPVRRGSASSWRTGPVPTSHHLRRGEAKRPPTDASGQKARGGDRCVCVCLGQA